MNTGSKRGHSDGDESSGPGNGRPLVRRPKLDVPIGQSKEANNARERWRETRDMLHATRDMHRATGGATVTERMLGHFEVARQVAEDLLQKEIVVIPPEIAKGWSPAEFISRVQNVVYKRLFQIQQYDWTFAMTDVENLWGSASRKVLENQYDKLVKEYDEERHDPPGDLERYKLEAIWLGHANELASRQQASTDACGQSEERINRHNRGRFQRCRDLAMQIADGSPKHLIYPDRWDDTNGHQTPDEYCLKLSTRIRELARQTMRAIYDEEIRRYKDGDAKETLKLKQKTVLDWWLPVRGIALFPRQMAPDRDSESERPTFDAEGAGLPGNWHHCGSLGKGAFGQATAWARVDDKGRMIDRMAIKDSRWTHGYGERAERVPREWEMQRRVNAIPGSENTVTVRAFTVNEMTMSYRLYLELCEHGDLLSMVERYESEDEDNPIAERIVWCAFDALASALCILHHGYIPGATAPARHRIIVHRDIKDRNVFLARPDDNNWPRLPTFKLGDFGLAVEFDGLDENKLRGSGTMNWMAPEQHINEAHPQAPRYPASHKVDIWGVGRIVHTLMHHATAYYSVRATYSDYGKVALPFQSDIWRGYSAELKHLVQSCLWTDPSGRPTALKLWETIHEHVAKSDRPMKFEEPGEKETILYPKDNYRKWVKETESE